MKAIKKKILEYKPDNDSIEILTQEDYDGPSSPFTHPFFKELLKADIRVIDFSEEFFGIKTSFEKLVETP